MSENANFAYSNAGLYSHVRTIHTHSGAQTQAQCGTKNVQIFIKNTSQRIFNSDAISCHIFPFLVRCYRKADINGNVYVERIQTNNDTDTHDDTIHTLAHYHSATFHALHIKKKIKEKRIPSFASPSTWAPNG